MPTKTRKTTSKFKAKDFNKAIDLMKERNIFEGPELMEIAKELDIPKPRIYNYRNKYLKEIGILGEDKKIKTPTAIIVESKIVGKFGNMDMATIDEELEKLTHFKWDGMNFLLHCINEFKVIVSDPVTKLEEKIKLFQLIAPYITAKVPVNSESNGQGNTLTVANIYNQAQQFYQQQNFIADETDQDSNKRNKKK